MPDTTIPAIASANTCNLVINWKSTPALFKGLVPSPHVGDRVGRHSLLGAPCLLKVHQLELGVGRRNAQSSQPRVS